MFTCSVFWHLEAGETFQYRGQTRWSGPWDNPNIFGLLMGTGIALAIGGAVLSFQFQVSSEGIKAYISWKRLCAKSRKWIFVFLCLFAVLMMARGLLHSYSRGAWLAACFGLAYLLWQWINRESNLLRSSRRNEAHSSEHSTFNREQSLMGSTQLASSQEYSSFETLRSSAI